MCAPATAALLLAALAALPCRGTDADDATSKTSNETDQKTQPTINILYQMLYTNSDLHNQSKLLDSNYSLNVNSFNLNNNLYSSVPVGKVQGCCQIDDVTEVNLSKEGAKFVHKINVDIDRKRTRKRRVVNVVRTNGNVTRNERRKTTAETTTVITLVKPPVAIGRKRKPGETGSSAPLLNYIFDAYATTHQHRDRPGHANSIYAAASPEVEALVGSTAHLDCKVDALHDKLVSWVRRKNPEEPMELLTTGTQLYTADDRYSSRFIPPDIWRLQVKGVRPTDAALYDCQLSVHPPRTARVTLRVPEVSVQIVDGASAAVAEQVCELGSTVALRCEVRGLRMDGGPSLLWYRREALLNDDTTRGGISVRTEFGANGANSVLRVARVRADDAGRYTCRVTRAPTPAPPDAHVILHIIKGESLAELHQGGGTATLACRTGIVITLAVCFSLYI